MKKVLFLMFLLFLTSLGTVHVNAQVTIGSNAAPDKFSLLDLVTTNIQKGIHMPRLTTAQRNALIAATAADSTAAKGLAVFNTTTNCYDVWNGKQWLSLCDAVSNPLRIIQQPAPFTFRRLWDTVADPNGPRPAAPVTLSVTATGSGTLSYKWYTKSRNMNDTRPGTVLATTATYSPPITGWAFTNYYCVVSNGTDSVVSNLAGVAIGCGARTIDGGWLQMMCQNLGAAPAPADLDAITFANDTTSSDAKGWLFQWGRRADGHQWRSSQAVTGPYYSTTAGQPASVGADTIYYGKYITNDSLKTFNDWRTPQVSLNWAALNSAFNPCPQVGNWHIPTSLEWNSITSDKSWLAYWNTTPNSFILVGNGVAIRPDGITTTAWLPLAGTRTADHTAAFQYDVARYWSNTPVGVSYYAWISWAGATYLNLQAASGANGFSVRCVQ